jgi:hypothetical protein
LPQILLRQHVCSTIGLRSFLLHELSRLGEIDAPTRQSLLALRNCPINYWKTFGSAQMRDFSIVIDAAARLHGPDGPRAKRRG